MEEVRFKREDFQNEVEYKKYLKNIETPPKRKYQKSTFAKVNKNHEAWKMWAKVNHES